MKNTKMLDIVRRLKMVRIPSPYFCTEPDRVERRAPRVTIPRNGKRFGFSCLGSATVYELGRRSFSCSCSSSVSLSKDEGYTMHGGHPRHHVGNTPPSLFAATCAIVVVRGDTKRRGDVSSASRRCFSPLFLVRERITKETEAFLSRLFAELVVEILAALDDEPRKRALRVARADGVALGHAPVLALHVLLRVESGAASGERATDAVRRKRRNEAGNDPRHARRVEEKGVGEGVPERSPRARTREVSDAPRTRR